MAKFSEEYLRGNLNAIHKTGVAHIQIEIEEVGQALRQSKTTPSGDGRNS